MAFDLEEYIQNFFFTWNIWYTECPSNCLLDKCFEKKSWTDKNHATECLTCMEHYYTANSICYGEYKYFQCKNKVQRIVFYLQNVPMVVKIAQIIQLAKIAIQILQWIIN